MPFLKLFYDSPKNTINNEYGQENFFEVYHLKKCKASKELGNLVSFMKSKQRALSSLSFQALFSKSPQKK